VTDLRVMILLMADFTNMEHGGTMWAMNFLQTLAEAENLRLTVVTFGPERVRDANDRTVKSLGLDHIFIPMRPEPVGDASTLPGRLAKMVRGTVTVALEKYYFLWEREARRQHHIDAEVTRIVAGIQPDVLVIGYLFLSLFVPSIFKMDIPRCVITANNEREFHRQLRSQGGPVGTQWHQRLGRWLFRHGNGLANRRVSVFERRVYESCEGVGALTRTDLPEDLPASIEQAIIPPILTQNELQWRYHSTRAAFFVGRISYYPNRLAIEWLCTRLAPELERLDAGVRINIIGAEPAEVPAHWVRPNINLMGASTREEVIHQMTTADLFIAPIANNFGAKLKLAECISHGMPFLATLTAMSGLPFLRSMPQISLEDPPAAARHLVEYVDDPGRLAQLSESILAQTRAARALQVREWASFLRRAADG
jgi:glycosyltransferase involved in cell wall biosynthesis